LTGHFDWSLEEDKEEEESSQSVSQHALPCPALPYLACHLPT
jgi:hypothetical protein